MDVLLFVIGVLIIAVGLAVSIAVHELGHLWPAKKFGIRVGQYMIGFGPTLWSKRRGETEYGIKGIPLGGYISMAGMYPPSPEQRAGEGRAGGGFFATMVQDARAANDETFDGDHDTRVFYRLPVWKRVVIMLGGPFMNLALALVLFALLFTGIGIQTASTTVSTVSECVLPAGSTVEECTAADPVAPAAEAGLLPGDEIAAIDGAQVGTFTDVSEIVRASPGEQLSFEIVRDGVGTTVLVTPMLAERPLFDADGRQVLDAVGEPATIDVGFIGVAPQFSLERQPIWAGPQAAADNVGQVGAIIIQLPVRVYDTAVSLFTGADRDPNGPLSVVGVGRIAGEVAAIDAPVTARVSTLIGLLASLNIALFVFNLIPLLPLDGGHVVVALWDGIKRWWARVRGKAEPAPVDAAKLVPVTFVVVIVLVGMGAILILADLVNPISLFGG